MKGRVERDSDIYRGITSLAILSTFITFSIFTFCMSAAVQPFSQLSASAPERLETEKIISRELWDRIFKQWSCNNTLCFKKSFPEGTKSSESESSSSGKMPWPSKRINHSERILSTTDSLNQNKQNNYGRVFLAVSFLLFLSILTISIARECRQETLPTNSSRVRQGTRRRSNPRARSSNTRRADQPVESIQIISDSRGGVLNSQNIGLSVQQRQISLSYYYIEPRRMLWNSLHPSDASPDTQTGVEDENPISTQSSVFHPDFQVPSFYPPDCPPTYQEISVRELPSYNEAMTNHIYSEKVFSDDNNATTIPVSQDNNVLNKSHT